jgi:hypothetical protein
MRPPKLETQVIDSSALNQSAKLLASEFADVVHIIRAAISSLNFHPPVTLGIEELGLILRKKPESIYADRVRRPDVIPPPLKIEEGGRLLWLYEDVVDWLRAHRAPASSTRSANNDADTPVQQGSRFPSQTKKVVKKGAAGGVGK